MYSLSCRIGTGVRATVLASVLTKGETLGLFSRGAPADARYALPKASNRDYYKYQHVSRNEYPMMNLAFFEKTLQQGLAPDAVLQAVLASEGWGPDVDIAAMTGPLVEEIFRRSSDVPRNEQARAAYDMDVRVGILAGIFERRSGQYRRGLRHPAIWNALSMYMKSQDEGGAGLTEAQNALRFATPHLGYSQGIEPGTAVASLFDRWNA